MPSAGDLTGRPWGALALALVALAAGCAAPRQLYPGAALPRDQVATLRGTPFFAYRDAGPGKGNTMVAHGGVILIGLDGALFAQPVPTGYEGQTFALLPGGHLLTGYCQYEAIDQGRTTARLYSDRFRFALAAQAGCEYTYEAEFLPGKIKDEHQRDRDIVLCRPLIRLFTDGRGCAGVDVAVPPVPVTRSGSWEIREEPR